jgi:hypothetical protein
MKRDAASCALAILWLGLAVIPADGQALRAAYQFGSGRAWSAVADLPQYAILDIGRGLRPIAVNDSGTVLLHHEAHRLVRWTWGSDEILLAYFPATAEAHLNERGTVAAISGFDQIEPEILHWPPGQNTPVSTGLGPNILDAPVHAILYALNDLDRLALRTDSQDNLTFLPPQNIRIATEIASLATGGWENLATYRYFHDMDFSVTRGGVMYDVSDLNNYGDTVGYVYEDHAVETPWDPGPVYTYQNQYFALNGDTALGFEPLQVNDARTILGRTLGPVHSMVILDAFGERDIGPVAAALADTRPMMSNPDNGLEEIILGSQYWKRMTERDLQGQPTGKPSPDFHQAPLREIITDSGAWSGLEAICISANGRIAGTGWIFDEDTAAMEKHAFLLVPPLLLPDWNRDGRIDEFDRNFCHKGEPWRFWINDDDDDAPVSSSSADDLPGSATPDFANEKVDGIRDVVDFFPVHLDLREVLQAIGNTAGIDIILRQADGALNFCYTSLSPGQVGEIRTGGPQQGFGAAMGEPLESAGVIRVTEAGVALSENFISAIRNANKGVLLFEVRGSSTAPLQLELRRDGVTILATALPISTGPVKDMFRLVNLRNADPKFTEANPGPWPTRTGDPPNLPDRFLESLSTPLRTLLHVHGYNWGGDQSPASHSEIFKRFFQCGSPARFVGVSWFGDQGMLDLIGASLDYNENVINAFVTAKLLPQAIAPFSGPWSYILAHSLGNMVVSSAIADHGLQAAACFLLDAAVPLEAYTGESADRRLMVHPDWRDYIEQGNDYAEHLLSANWSRLFAADDNRSMLTWKNRFDGLDSAVTCYNFYSSGEEVLRSGNGDLPSLLGDIIDTEWVWTYNEMVKGTSSLGATLAGEVHGGWGFNREWMEWVDPGGAAHPPTGDWVPVPPSDANAIDPALLAADPFFRPFSSGDADFPAWGDGQWLYSDAASANARLPSVPMTGAPMDLVKNHAKILAEALPAHSAPAGSNPLDNLPLLRNFDADRMFRDPAHWPVRDDPGKRDRWLHSDYLDTALSHVAGLYLAIIDVIEQTP